MNRQQNKMLSSHLVSLSDMNKHNALEFNSNWQGSSKGFCFHREPIFSVTIAVVVVKVVAMVLLFDDVLTMLL